MNKLYGITCLIASALGLGLLVLYWLDIEDLGKWLISLWGIYFCIVMCHDGIDELGKTEKS